MRVFSIYLPQFYPTEENNRWYGKGYTEWTNVAKAKPLFRGHYQPHIPRDLGFYDLRLKDIRYQQAEMAHQYGIEGFTYYHYWFGEGRQLLEKPMQWILKDRDYNFPFSFIWANETWKKKLWNSKEKDEIIMLQQYLGEKDIEDHFYKLLPFFKDERYTRVDGKLLFSIYNPLAHSDIELMIDIWSDLAIKEGLGGFYFVGKCSSDRYHNFNTEAIYKLGFNSIYSDTYLNVHMRRAVLQKARLKLQRNIFGLPTVYKYEEAIKHMFMDNWSDDNVIPTILPNWDHSPRSGRKATIYTNCKPELFGQLATTAIDSLKDKPKEKQIIFIRAWNEWGEGNHLEPDLKYGVGYLEALKKAIDESQL